MKPQIALSRCIHLRSHTFQFHELEDVQLVESKELDMPLKCFQLVFLFRQLTKLIFFDTFCLPISYLTDRADKPH